MDALMYLLPSDGNLAVEIFIKVPISNAHADASAFKVVFCGHGSAADGQQYFSEGQVPGADEFLGQYVPLRHGITSVAPPGQYAPA